MKCALLLMLVATCAFAQEDAPEDISARWESLRPSGALRFDYFSSSRTLDDRKNFPGGTLQAKIQPVWNAALRGKFEGRITQPKLGSGTADSTLLESWLALRTEASALLLSDGSVLLVGGALDLGLNPLASMERYVPDELFVGTFE